MPGDFNLMAVEGYVDREKPWHPMADGLLLG